MDAAPKLIVTATKGAIVPRRASSFHQKNESADSRHERNPVWLGSPCGGESCGNRIALQPASTLEDEAQRYKNIQQMPRRTGPIPRDLFACYKKASACLSMPSFQGSRLPGVSGKPGGLFEDQ